MNHIQNRTAGYAFLIKHYQLKVIPNWHLSRICVTGGTKRQAVINGKTETIFPSSYWPGDGIQNHLEFALKYDGVNLGVLSAVFQQILPQEMAEWISQKSQGKYYRRLWFLYEFITGHRLPLDDLKQGNYIELLEPEKYFVIFGGENVKRQRIVCNLPGGRDFCPLIRRTDKLRKMENLDIRASCDDIISSYSPDLLRRALNYLYQKETKSSFEIEHITPIQSRTDRFIKLLSMAEQNDFCAKELLVELQNRTVDQRFQDSDYRSSQNYVGQSASFRKQIIHYICPKPEDVHALMNGWIQSHEIMTKGNLNPVAHAAAISYGFVFIHPFEDGNGRIHRFLIHNVLSLRKVTVSGLMFPISAVMLSDPKLYDSSLEAFSIPLVELMDYTLDESGRMQVLGETCDFYRYIDMTAQTEALYDFIEITIDRELKAELDFLEGYDKAWKSIQYLIDMPDKLINLFIDLCLQSNGTLSLRKRQSHFHMLTDDEISSLEQVVRKSFTLK